MTLASDGSLPAHEDFRRSKTCIIGHELPDYVKLKLHREDWTYVDIRVSPVRFHNSDFILAISSNNHRIQKLLGYTSMDGDFLKIEAAALSSSLRWRNFGQHQIRENSAVIILEKPADNDSVLRGVDLSIATKINEIEKLCADHDAIYYLPAGAELRTGEAEALHRVGAMPLQINLYAILASRNIRTVVGRKSGALVEAKYFGKNVLSLDGPTTPLFFDEDDKIDGMYFNIHPATAMLKDFWGSLLGFRLRTTMPRTRQIIVQDLLRRSVNEWNSYAPIRWIGTKEHDVLLRSLRA